MKYVHETKAGQSISAFIIFKGNKQVGKVQVHYGNSKVITNVWNFGKGETSCTGCQFGSASGYGYDKSTAALRGSEIDGITLNDHCGTDAKTEKLLKQYQSGKITLEDAQKKARKMGASFANWYDQKDGKGHMYQSLHLLSGLSKLEALGYKVYQAI